MRGRHMDGATPWPRVGSPALPRQEAGVPALKGQWERFSESGGRRAASVAKREGSGSRLFCARWLIFCSSSGGVASLAPHDVHPPSATPFGHQQYQGFVSEHEPIEVSLISSGSARLASVLVASLHVSPRLAQHLISRLASRVSLVSSLGQSPWSRAVLRCLASSRSAILLCHFASCVFYQLAPLSRLALLTRAFLNCPFQGESTGTR